MKFIASYTNPISGNISLWANFVYEKKGSKVKPVDFFKGIMELLRLNILLNFSEYQNDIVGIV